jgi:hypothetical protein
MSLTKKSKRDVRLTVTVDGEDWDQLTAIAEAAGDRPADLIKDAIKLFIDRLDPCNLDFSPLTRLPVETSDPSGNSPRPDQAYPHPGGADHV